MKKLFIIISIILFSINTYSSGPPNSNCLPFSECWCAKNPGHRQCNSTPCYPPQACVSINEEIEYLALAGGLLLIYYYKSKK